LNNLIRQHAGKTGFDGCGSPAGNGNRSRGGIRLDRPGPAVHAYFLFGDADRRSQCEPTTIMAGATNALA
jgi:hypothetical protein